MNRPSVWEAENVLPYGPGNADYEYDQSQKDDDMRLCKDCAHFIEDGAKCGMSPMPIDYVNGVERGYYSAQNEREAVSGCGALGQWWQEKPQKVAA